MIYAVESIVVCSDPNTLLAVLIKYTAILLTEFMIESVHAFSLRFIAIDTLSSTHQNFSFRCFEHTADFLSFPVAIYHLLIVQHYFIHAGMIITHSLIIKSYPNGIIFPVAIDALNTVSYCIT